MMRSPLNPCDYFLLMLDEAIRRQGLSGSSCVAHLRLDDVPPRAELESYARELAARHPCVDSRLTFSFLFRRARWAYPVGTGIPVREGRDLESILNAPMDARQDPPLELYRMPDGVAVRWHHALMDAKGAERLLAGGASGVAKGREYEPDLGKHSWLARMRMCLRMRDMFRALDARRPALFEHEPREGAKTFALRTHSFDAAETASILSRATSLCGPFQRNIYFLACFLRALAQVVREPGPLVVPLQANLRKREWSPVAANYLTFFHFIVEQDAARDVAELAKLLKDQHVAQIRRQDDAAMAALLNLGRRLGLKRYLRERVSKEGRERVTAYFSYPGETEVTEFLGRPVREYRAFPTVPARPGVGVFLSLSGGRLCMTCVFVRENVEAARVDEFLRILCETL